MTSRLSLHISPLCLHHPVLGLRSCYDGVNAFVAQDLRQRPYRLLNDYALLHDIVFKFTPIPNYCQTGDRLIIKVFHQDTAVHQVDNGLERRTPSNTSHVHSAKKMTLGVSRSFLLFTARLCYINE